MKTLIKFLYPIFALITAMVGYHIHGSIGYAITDFFFWPIAWAYWLITHNVNLTVIKETFAFLLK